VSTFSSTEADGLGNLEAHYSSGGIGNLSARIGYDVRELLMQGYSPREIGGVTLGEYTLQELLSHKPGEIAKRKKGRR
jgi:hypothetical protein